MQIGNKARIPEYTISECACCSAIYDSKDRPSIYHNGLGFCSQECADQWAKDQAEFDNHYGLK